MISFFAFFCERCFNCRKYRKTQNKTKRVVISSNIYEVNKTVHIIFKYDKRLKRKIKTPKRIKTGLIVS